MGKQTASKIVELDNTIIRALNCYDKANTKSNKYSEAIFYRAEQGYDKPIDAVSYSRIIENVGCNGGGYSEVAEAWKNEDWKGIWTAAVACLKANRKSATEKVKALPPKECLEKAEKEVAPASMPFHFAKRPNNEISDNDVMEAENLVKKYGWILKQCRDVV